MKEELKKYFNINIYKLEEERRSLSNNYILYYDLLKEIKEKPEEERKKEIEKYNLQQKEKQEKLEKINKKIEIESIQKNILYNNIIYLFYKNYHNIIMDILEKYKNKNIGEKTKEKIQEEIKEKLEKDNIYVTVTFSFGSYSDDIYKLYFTIYRTKEEKEKYSYFNIEFTFSLCKYYQEEDQEKYNNYFIYRNEKDYINIINNNMLWDNNIQYNYINDPKKQATIILKECKKNINKVNKLIEAARKTREENNNLLNIYKIHGKDFLKIEYNQTL